jgi:hypothetical protein
MKSKLGQPLPIAARRPRKATSRIGGGVTRGIMTIPTIKLEKLADRIAEVEAIFATANVVTAAKTFSGRVRIHSYFEISRDK